MYHLTSIPSAVQVTGPVAEPVTLSEAKKHLELSLDESQHDSHLAALIQAARQKWENDTQTFLISRSMSLTLPMLCEFAFPHKPVTAITAVTYYDADNALQTLSNTLYQLDTARSIFRQAYGQTWPTITDRWDCVLVSYTLGSHTSATTVPEVAKAAMKLLIGFYFENRDMLAPDQMQSIRPYEHLVHNYMRSSYP